MVSQIDDRRRVARRAVRNPQRRFVVAGPQYPKDIEWPANVDHIDHLPPSRHARFYSSIGWALNLTRDDMVTLGYSPSVRIFEAAACATPILSDFEQTMGKDVLDMCRATVGRHASVDDIVPVISFLGSPEARWITGQDIQVDAGFVNSMIAGPPIKL